MRRYHCYNPKLLLWDMLGGDRDCSGNFIILLYNSIVTIIEFLNDWQQCNKDLEIRLDFTGLGKVE